MWHIELNCVRGEHKPARCRCFAAVTLRLTPWLWNSKVKPFKIYSLSWKSTKIAFKVKGEGRMSPTSNHFYVPSYVDFQPVVFEIFCGHRLNRQTPPKMIPARSMRCNLVGICPARNVEVIVVVVKIAAKHLTLCLSCNGLYFGTASIRTWCRSCLVLS